MPAARSLESPPVKMEVSSAGSAAWERAVLAGCETWVRVRAGLRRLRWLQRSPLCQSKRAAEMKHPAVAKASESTETSLRLRAQPGTWPCLLVLRSPVPAVVGAQRGASPCSPTSRHCWRPAAVPGRAVVLGGSEKGAQALLLVKSSAAFSCRLTKVLDLYS